MLATANMHTMGNANGTANVATVASQRGNCDCTWRPDVHGWHGPWPQQTDANFSRHIARSIGLPASVHLVEHGVKGVNRVEVAGDEVLRLNGQNFRLSGFICAGSLMTMTSPANLHSLQCRSHLLAMVVVHVEDVHATLANAVRLRHCSPTSPLSTCARCEPVVLLLHLVAGSIRLSGIISAPVFPFSLSILQLSAS